MPEKRELEFSKELKVNETPIPGLLEIDLQVFGDTRGWFKENWQKSKIESAGLPEFSPVQNNISFNATRGTTRGIHAEPWDKYISVGSGRVFGAWVDLRDGETFGQVYTAEIDPTRAIFVPRGVANAFQALEDNTVYTYLVNDHWTSDAEYTFLNLADSTAGIDWPIPLSDAEISEKDLSHPSLEYISPIKPKRTLITGANGQLGRALQVEFPEAEFADSNTLDITSADLDSARNWRNYSTIINAAAYTNVDGAETPEGRKLAWKINANAVANLGRIATKYGLVLVHVSSDYVFDGTIDNHTEDEDFSPLGVYAQSKAAGDIATEMVQKCYLARTSWVVGDGKNFIRTMAELAKRGIKPNVVNDQIGRLTFADDLAKGIKHLIETKAPYGTYNISGDGNPMSFADIAKKVYQLMGYDPNDVTGIPTEEYYKGKEGIAPRPLQSTLDLSKIKSVGFYPADQQISLEKYIKQEGEK